MLEDLALNLVLELLELVQLGELVLLLEEHLRGEGRGRGGGQGRRSRVQALEGHQVGHGHEIEGLLVRCCEILEGIGYTMGEDVCILGAILVGGGVGKEKGEEVLLLVILVHGGSRRRALEVRDNWAHVIRRRKF